MGFVFPWEKWMKKELKEFSYSGLTDLEQLNIFNIDEVYSLWNGFLSGNKLCPWHKIWSLVVLGKWISINNQHV